MGGATGGGGRGNRIDTATSTAGQDGRNFNFDVLPTELFSSAVVSKSPTASSTEGGIAALISLLSPSPFDLDETAATVSAQGNWGEEGDVEPRISGLFSKQFNEQFALLIGGVYSRNDSFTTQVGFDRFVPLSTLIADPTTATQAQLDAFVPRGAAYIARQRDVENLSGLLTAEWRPTDRIEFRFDAIVTDSDGFETQTEQFFDLTRGLPGPTTLDIDSNGVATSGTFASFRRAQAKFRHDGIDDKFKQFTLAGNIDITDTWSLAPFIGYNERESNRPFNQVDYFASGAASSFTYSLVNGVDSFSTPLTDFSGNPQDFVLGDAFRADNISNSDQTDFKLDLIGEFDSLIRKVKVGVSYRERDSDVEETFRGALNFNPVSPTLDNLVEVQEFGLGNSPDTIFGLDVLDAASTLLAGQDLFDANFDITTTQFAGIVIGNADSDRLATSQVSEDILAAYAEMDIQFHNVTINAGFRVVETDQNSSGAQSVDGTVLDIAVGNKYTEWLPAVNLRWEVIPDLFLRGTYSKALSRPSLQALSPRETISFTSLTGSRGNPELEPFTVDQFDIGGEWYFDEEGLLGITYFEKDFTSVVGDETVVLQRLQASAMGGPTIQNVTFTQPLNTGSARVKGFEISAQTSLFFLPGEFKNAGVIFNYTDLSSNTDITTPSGTQSQPFPNLSPSSLNAALYYDNGKYDARLGYTWREGFLQDGFDPDGNFFKQEDFGTLNLTANMKWNDKLTFQLQANNLLDEELEFSSSSREVKVRRLDLERRVVFGARYEFF